MNRPSLNILGAIMLLSGLGMTTILAAGAPQQPVSKRPHVAIRGVYGGVPQQIFDRGASLDDFAINAIWIGSGGVTRDLVAALKARSKTLKIFVEFNTMHEASYLKDHPDASPKGADGKVSPPPDGWQGVCPTHPGYRRDRMEAFRHVLKVAPIDGIWLDYHHAHASWEQAQPNIPVTCFCDRCLSLFQQQTHISLPQEATPTLARLILESHKNPPGSSGVATCSPTGSANSAKSSTRNAPKPCWALFIAHGLNPITTAPFAKSSRSTCTHKQNIWTFSRSCPTTPVSAMRTTPVGSHVKPPRWAVSSE